jgi:hypothetical protein
MKKEVVYRLSNADIERLYCLSVVVNQAVNFCTWLYLSISFHVEFDYTPECTRL